MSRIVEFALFGAPEVLKFKEISDLRPSAGEVRILIRTQAGKEVILGEMRGGQFFGELAVDPSVSGILVQLPAAELDGQALTALIPAEKDVDGLTPISVGLLVQNRPGLRPCTPLGVLELLDRLRVGGAEIAILP